MAVPWSIDGLVFPWYHGYTAMYGIGIDVTNVLLTLRPRYLSYDNTEKAGPLVGEMYWYGGQWSSEHTWHLHSAL